MPIDPAVIGKKLPPAEMTVDAGRLRFFAKAIGETNPIYTDAAAAQDAGYKDIPVPPTFFFAIELDCPDPFFWLSDIGVDMRFILHGEQSFTYHDIAYPGDTLIASPTITDVYSKKGGALEFIVKKSEVTRPDGSPVADLTTVIVARNPKAGQ